MVGAVGFVAFHTNTMGGVQMSNTWFQTTRVTPSSGTVARRAWMRTGIAVLAATFSCATVIAFTLEVHRQITIDTLTTMSATVAGQPAKFSERALQEIALANEYVDSIWAGNAAWFQPTFHFTNATLNASSQRLITLKQQIVAELTASTPNGARARELLGQALHAVQDFYSHSNWVELGNSGEQTLLGRAVLANPPASHHPCFNDGNDLVAGTGLGLTSAYFSGPNPLTGRSGAPNGGCYHGNYTESCDGINKDRNEPPGDPLHAKAVQLAILATRDYTQQVLDEIAGNDKAVSALLDVRGTCAFVIDDTGSMGTEIAGVKQMVTSLVNSLAADPAKAPTNWALLRFGDPDIGSAFVTSNVSQLLSAVNGLGVGGGGDCPELSQGALLKALDAVLPSSRIYLFTDASAKDSELKSLVSNRAAEVGAELSYCVTGSCSPIDPAYIDGAAATGGRIFVIGASEVAKLTGLVTADAAGRLQMITRAEKPFIAGSMSLDFPVDDTVSRLIVSGSGDVLTSGQLYRPDGTTVLVGQVGVTLSSLTNGFVLEVVSPPTGQWHLQVGGSGSASVVVSGISSLEFYGFEIVEPDPDLHGSYAPVPGQPISGTTCTALASLLGDYETAAFTLESESGSALGPIDLDAIGSSEASRRFLGPLAVPTTRSRVVVTGLTEVGQPYSRVFKSAITPQTLSVVPLVSAKQFLAAGSQTTMSFKVTNHGTAGQVNLSFVDTGGFLSSDAGQFVTLETEQSTIVDAQLSIPPETPTATNSSLGLIAERFDGSSANSASIEIEVTPYVPVFVAGDALDVHFVGDLDVQQLACDLVAGSKLNLKVTSPLGMAKSRIELIAPDGTLQASKVLSTKGKKPKKLAMKTKTSGKHLLVVTREAGGEGQLLIKTSRSLPKAAKRVTKKLVLAPGATGTTPGIPCLQGALIDIGLKSTSTENLSATLYAPGGEPLDLAALGAEVGPKSWFVADIPVPLTGLRYVAVTNHSTAKRVITVKCVITQPPIGSASVVVD